jgi:uncharacterized protein YcnI
MKRLALLIVIALGALLALAGPAAAHVTVTAPGATVGGSDQEITFRVPVEKDVATVGLTIALPVNTPIVGVLVKPMPGWTHTEKVSRLARPVKTDDGDISSAVSQISWTAAAGGGLKPGEYGDFTVIAGQLPAGVKSLTFKALQRYQDGSVVSWIETAAPGSSAAPENPAPVLQLAGATTEASAPAAAAHSGTGGSSSTTGPIVLSVIALVVAAGALGLAYVSRARSRI